MRDMRTTPYSTVDTARTAIDAEKMIAILRNAGLHPADLAVVAPFPLPGTSPSFPIQVPDVEAKTAREVFRAPH
jgi:hypothetical protein